MRFGLRLNSDICDVHECIRLAKVAEESGFHYFWYCEDLMKRDAWVVLSAVALNTERIKLGTCLVNPYSSSPAEIAMRAATLQELSSGRFVLGIGPGAVETLKWVGIEPQKPVTGLRKAVIILKKLLEGGVVYYEGEVFRMVSGQAYMRMPTPHHTPIYVGGQGVRILRMIGELCDGGLPLLVPPETAEDVVALIREGAYSSGRKMEEVDIVGCIWYSVADTLEKARNLDSLRQLISYYGYMLNNHVLRKIGLSKEDFNHIRYLIENGRYEEAKSAVDGRMFDLAVTASFADKHEIINKFEMLEKAGVGQVNIGPPLGPDMLEAILFTGREIIPELSMQE